MASAGVLTVEIARIFVHGQLTRPPASVAVAVRLAVNPGSPGGLRLQPTSDLALQWSSRNAMAEETLIQKIRSLPPERVAEVEDFVDSLTVRDRDRHFTQAAERLSEEAFRAVWDNPDDAEYDRL